MRAVVEERSRMAREIHDTLAQGFAGIALQLESVLQKPWAKGVEIGPIAVACRWRSRAAGKLTARSPRFAPCILKNLSKTCCGSFCKPRLQGATLELAVTATGFHSVCLQSTRTGAANCTGSRGQYSATRAGHTDRRAFGIRTEQPGGGNCRRWSRLRCFRRTVSRGRSFRNYGDEGTRGQDQGGFRDSIRERRYPDRALVPIPSRQGQFWHRLWWRRSGFKTWIHPAALHRNSRA